MKVVGKVKLEIERYYQSVDFHIDMKISYKLPGSFFKHAIIKQNLYSSLFPDRHREVDEILQEDFIKEEAEKKIKEHLHDDYYRFKSKVKKLNKKNIKVKVEIE